MLLHRKGSLFSFTLFLRVFPSGLVSSCQTLGRGRSPPGRPDVRQGAQDARAASSGLVRGGRRDSQSRGGR